jgi:antirestriction protein ArdC
LRERFLILLRDIPQQVLLHMINALDGLELEEVSVGAVLRHEVGHGFSHLILLVIEISRLGKFRTVQHHSIVIEIGSTHLGEAQPQGRSPVVVHTLDEPAGVGEQAVVLLEEVVVALQG